MTAMKTNIGNLGVRIAVSHRDPKTLKAYPGHARLHPKSQIRKLARNIEQFGFVTPILVDTQDMVVAGHARLEAALRLELPEVPVVRIDHLTPAELGALRLADNRLAEEANWDPGRLRIELEELRLTSFSLSGPPQPRLLINHWNSVCTKCKNWPGVPVDEILPYSPVRVQWTAFPLQLREGIDEYLGSLAKPHHVVNDRRWKACKRSTIETRRRELESFARKAVEAGIKINRLRSLRILLSPGVVFPTIEAYINENSGRSGRYAVDLGRKIHGIAKAIGAPSRTIAQLDVIKTRLSRARGHALSSRAIDTIREVLSGDIWPRVVALPRSLFAEAERLRRIYPVKSRALATIALQIQILTRAPVRCCDLLSIRIGTNLRREAGQKKYELSFPGYDPKNRIDLQFPISLETSRMIARYLRAFHPNPRSPKWLFELSDGQRRNSNAASEAIGRVLEERVGMRIMAQQFRHAAAALILKDAPGNYQYVRRVLGHLNLQTTIKLYSSIEDMKSSDVFSNLLTRSLKLRTATPA